MFDCISIVYENAYIYIYTVCFVDMDARYANPNPSATFRLIFHELPSFVEWEDKFVTELRKALIIYNQYKTYLIAVMNP
jgi:hypothetical protein